MANARLRDSECTDRTGLVCARVRRTDQSKRTDTRASLPPSKKKVGSVGGTPEPQRMCTGERSVPGINRYVLYFEALRQSRHFKALLIVACGLQILLECK